MRFGERVEFHQGLDQPRHLGQMDHVRPVGGRVVGIGMRFDEDGRHPKCDCGPRHHRGELALSAGPDRVEENMDRETVDECLALLDRISADLPVILEWDRDRPTFDALVPALTSAEASHAAC